MKKFLLFAAALLGLVACNNKDNALNGEQPIEPGRQVTISATIKIPGGEKTPIRMVSPNASDLPGTDGSEIHFHWEAGDKVVLWNGDEGNPEYKEFTIIDDSINGDYAVFTGTALADMSEYQVFYWGKNTSIEKYKHILKFDIDSIEYEANNFHPYIGAMGDEKGFTLDVFWTVINVPLKGDATVGKIDYYFTNSTSSPYDYHHTTTMTFGSGLALTDTEAPVYIPLTYTGQGGFKLEIYDTDDQLLLEKTVESSVLYDNEVTLIHFPALTVNTAPVTKGKAKRKLAGGGEVDVDWVQLWAGGPKWATYNVGATTATEYGDYFCWGGSYANGEGKAFQDDHNTGDANIQYGADDTAKKLWGDNWQMPTKTQLGGLVDNTSYEWIENYQSSGKNGYLFTGKGDYSDNSIFLPAAGNCVNISSTGKVYGAETMGTYWGSTPNGVTAAWSLFINSSKCELQYNNRGDAYSVRAVLYEPGPSAPENVNLPNVNKTDGSW